MNVKIFILSFLLLYAKTFAQHADDILGNWISTDKSVAVAVYKSGDQYRAKILWFDGRLGSGKPIHERRDVSNPDPALRKRKIIGMEILEGLQYHPKTHSWEHGTIYDASSGRHWSSAVKLNDDGSLQVRGYWKFKWIGKSMTFIRLKHKL